MSQPLIKSNRQLIRIWYEFLRLSYEIPEMKDNLKKSRSYYRKWGTKNEILTTKFDKWWTDHKPLFEGVDLRESDTISKDPLNLNVIVPIDAPIGESLRNFEEILRRKKNETKDLKREYAFSKDKNRIDGYRLYEILMIFGYWLKSGSPRINSHFIEGFEETLDNRKRSVWRPNEFQEWNLKPRPEKFEISDARMLETFRKEKKRSGEKKGADIFEISTARMRRTIRLGKKIADNVSQGVFPGIYR
jgi:hypothetical protein